MKKFICLILCAILVMGFATIALAADKLPIGGGQIGGGEIAEVTTFKAKVDAIPDEITLESKTAIEDAEAALDALKAKAGRDWALGFEKNLTQWITKLTNARTAYDTLVANQSQKPGGAIDETGDGIMMIVAIFVLSVTGMVVLVSKKRAF